MNRYFKAIKGLLNLKKTNEELIGSIDIRSGNIENITINPINSDSTEISISASLNNDILEINLPDETINIKDKDDNIIDTITFPVYSDVSIDIDTYCTPTNGSLPLTVTNNQVTADAKRVLNWYTLRENNPYGNKLRFTGTTGGGYNGTSFVDVNGDATTKALAYPNDLCLDWASSDHTRELVLLWYTVAQSGNYSGFTSIEPATFEGFNNFYFFDIQEFFSLANVGNTTNGGEWFNYEPFNYIVTSASDRLKTRTETFNGDTANTITYGATGNLDQRGKTQGAFAFFRRLTTYTELGL